MAHRTEDRLANQGTTSTRPRKERTENAERRRRQLVDATLTSVAENGLARTTLATVARAAGLSQGVAVFYFETKEKLLAAALSHQYGAYEESWKKALKSAGDDPARQLAALVRADLSEENCNRDALAVWFSFWGEASFRPRYAEIARDFDTSRSAEIERICAALMKDADSDAIRDAAYQIDSLTDGFWHRLYLTPETFTNDEGIRLTLAHLRNVFPERAEAFED